MNKQIKQDLEAALTQLLPNPPEVSVEPNKNFAFGDYSSNIVLILAKRIGMTPLELGQKIIALLPTSDYQTSLAANGFLNFTIAASAFTPLINEILQLDDSFGRQNFGQGKRINIEYVSANPTGALHIGHARQAALGDALSTLYRTIGYQVTREFYLNDCGNQVRLHGASLHARYCQLFGRDVAVPNDGYQGVDLLNIAEKIKAKVGDKYVNDDSDEAIQFFIQTGIELEIEQLKADLFRFGTTFDHFTSEAYLRSSGAVQAVLDKLTNDGATYELDGAVWLQTTPYGDDKDRVLIKTDGSYTYLLPDIAYHQDKLKRGFDQLINVLGADHHGYLARMQAALILLGHQKDQLQFVLSQMVRVIKDGEEIKLSKRTGKSLTLIDLIDEIGTDAARYALTARASTAHLEINVNLLTTQSSENPVYYVQYAHARICSILEKAQARELEPKIDLDRLTEPTEKALLLILSQYKGMIVDAALTFAPHKITTYMVRLAQTFHAFYTQCKVLDELAPEISQARLILVESTRIILRNSLSLIGVSAPVRM